MGQNLFSAPSSAVTKGQARLRVLGDLRSGCGQRRVGRLSLRRRRRHLIALQRRRAPVRRHRRDRSGPEHLWPDLLQRHRTRPVAQQLNRWLGRLALIPGVGPAEPSITVVQPEIHKKSSADSRYAWLVSSRLSAAIDCVSLMPRSCSAPIACCRRGSVALVASASRV
jgi:hypothetical protein